MSSFIRKKGAGTTGGGCHASFSSLLRVHCRIQIQQGQSSSSLGVYADIVGTRPGPHGIPVVSSGHADLDKLYGGGIPLGTLNLVSEDGWTSHHRYILQYFVSEGLAVGQVRV